MKVVLFCGGLGMRLHPDTEKIPKPLVTVGDQPLLLHLMKYYAYFGHKDFILCLGYKGDLIKKFFLNYDECLNNDFILLEGGKKKALFKSSMQDWRITFAETGLHSNIGQRLKSVQKYVEDDEIFLANYSDGLTDLSLKDEINFFLNRGKIACFLAVKPCYVFHSVSIDANNLATSIRSVSDSNLRINGGYFVFKNSIFDYINEGEDLVNEPFQRLIKKRELLAFNYAGFWASLDTFKDKLRLDELVANGNGLWKIWEKKE